MTEILIRARHYRGVADANLTCDPLALVAGNNAKGKSSLAQAVGAALAGQALPDAVSSKNAATVVRDGEARGEIEISAPQGSVTMTWPDCTSRTQGTLGTSGFAAGLRSLVDLGLKDRAQTLIGLLHAEPDYDELKKACTSENLGASAATALWELITEHGWDAAQKIRRDRGVEMKSEWHALTHQNWGSRIGATWAPEDWDDALAGKTENDLRGEIKAAEKALRDAETQDAIAAFERQRLTLESDDSAPRQAHATATAQLKEHEAAKLNAVRERELLGNPSENFSAVHCPECGSAFSYQIAGQLLRLFKYEARKDKPEDLKKQRMAIAAADGEIGRLEGLIGDDTRAIARAEFAIQHAREARAKLAAMPPDSGLNLAEQNALIGNRREELAHATRRAEAWRLKQQATTIDRQINANDRAIKLLAPDGLRAQKLLQVLGAFNHELARLAAAAEWQSPYVEPDMTIIYGTRPYPFCSASEQYRTRVVLAAAMALQDGSAMLVTDAADILDGKGRSELFSLLIETGLFALVCMTASSPEHVPDLGVYGTSYWIDEGQTAPLHEEVSA